MPRYFTLPEAIATLPLVRRIVADITTMYPKWRQLVASFEIVAAQSRPEWGESAEQVRLRTEIEVVARDTPQPSAFSHQILNAMPYARGSAVPK